MPDDDDLTYRPGGRLKPGPPSAWAIPGMNGTLPPDRDLTPAGWRPASAGPPEVPGYEFGPELGRGGMGVVYRATDLALQRPVAVKVLLPGGNDAAAQRFIDEARITGQLQHPGIPAVYQVGTAADGRPFLAMKLIRGTTLAEKLDAGVHFDTAAVFEAIARAVGYAHTEGVIHRDLKPGNVMVGAFGEVQVMDWGLAKVLPPVGAAVPPAVLAGPPPAGIAGGMTLDGMVVGTVAYMAPEQASGRVADVDARSDVFGLGAILCAMLTGRPPFEGTTVREMCQNAGVCDTRAAFARLDACRADPELVALCRRCLSRDKADRPADGADVADEVAHLRHSAGERARVAELARAAALARADADARRRRVTRAAAVLVAAVLLAGLIGTGAGLVRTKRALAAEAEQRSVADARTVDAESARALAETRRRVAEASQALAETRRLDAEAQRAAAETARVQTELALAFVEKDVFAAARPKVQDGGLGYDVTLRAALTAALPAVGKRFEKQPRVEARVRSVLAVTFGQLGDSATGAGQAELALAIRTRDLGPDHADTLDTETALAGNYIGLQRFEDARKLYAHVNTCYRRIKGEDDPATLRAARNLATACLELGARPQAQALLEDNLARTRRVLGPDHPDTLTTANNLAACYFQLGDMKAAMALYGETVQSQTRTLGAAHPSSVQSSHNLAHCYAAVGRRDEAAKMFADVFEKCRQVYGPDHPETLRTLNSLADLRPPAEALKVYRQILDARRRTIGPDHPDTLAAMYNIANTLVLLGRAEEARTLYEDALARQKRVLGPDHVRTLRTVNNLIGIHYTAGRQPEALALIDDFLANAKTRATPVWVASVAGLRVQILEKRGDAAGCRAAAAAWEAFDYRDANSFYNAACWRAVAAGLYRRAWNGPEWKADADRTIDALRRAKTAGYADAAHAWADPDLAPVRDRPEFRALFGPPPPLQKD